MNNEDRAHLLELVGYDIEALLNRARRILKDTKELEIAETYWLSQIKWAVGPENETDRPSLTDTVNSLRGIHVLP